MLRWEAVRCPESAFSFLPLFLLFQQLLFAGDVAAVAFGQHVFAHGFHGFAGNHLAADGGLHGDLEELAGNILLKLFADAPGAG